MKRRSFLKGLRLGISGSVLLVPEAMTKSERTLVSKVVTPATDSFFHRLKIKKRGKPVVSQNVFEKGKAYRITGSMRSDGKSLPAVMVGDEVVFKGANIKSDWQSFDLVVKAKQEEIKFGVLDAIDPNGFVDFDSLSVTEVM